MNSNTQNQESENPTSLITSSTNTDLRKEKRNKFRTLNKDLFEWYDRNTVFSYREEKQGIVKQLGYQFISEMIIREYEKGLSTREVANKLGYLTACGLRYHFYELQELTGKRILRSRGGANNLKGLSTLTDQQRKQIQNLYLNKRFGYRRISKKLNIPEGKIRRFLFSSGTWKKGYLRRGNYRCP